MTSDHGPVRESLCWSKKLDVMVSGQLMTTDPAAARPTETTGIDVEL
jgi:hypothetical protein